MRSAIVTFLALCWGCGGAGQQGVEEPSPMEGQGDEPAAAFDSTEGQEPAGPEGASDWEDVSGAPLRGPASLTVNTTVKGEPIGASVRLVDAEGQQVAEGSSGQALRVPAGTYSAEIRVTDAKALMDQPSETREFHLQPGATVTEQVPFPWARVRLNVRVNGRLNRNAVVKLIRNGEHVATLKSAASDYVMVSPGRYAAEVQVGKTVVNVDSVMLPEGGTREVPVDVKF